MEFPRAVLGDDLRFWAAHTLWSPQLVNYELSWHKDNYENGHYDPSGRSRHVQFNFCLTADDSFRAIPGSHRRPMTDQEHTVVEAHATGPLAGEVIVPCQAGDVLYMNYHMIHRGSCTTRGTAGHCT